LNPEYAFRASAANDPGAVHASRSNVGLWLAKRLEGLQPSAHATLPSSDIEPTVHQLLLPLLHDEFISNVPSQKNLESLSSIYFDMVHPLIPVVDKANYKLTASGEPHVIILRQGVCLVASMNREAHAHLFLPGASACLGPREFGKRILASMKTCIDIGLITDKIVLIQALVLMSFFMEGPEGRDMASQLCARAVECAFSVGLHLKDSQNHQDDAYAVSLFCCVWALDRMHAAFHGRPVMMHERDIRGNFHECFKRQEACFRLLLSVVALLDNVIDLYRPGFDPETTGWEGHFPSFEELWANTSGASIGTSLVGTLRLARFYDFTGRDFSNR